MRQARSPLSRYKFLELVYLIDREAFGYVCIRDRKSAAWFGFPGIYAITILNAKTLSRKFQTDGGIDFD